MKDFNFSILYLTQKHSLVRYSGASEIISVGSIPRLHDYLLPFPQPGIGMAQKLEFNIRKPVIDNINFFSNKKTLTLRIGAG